MDSCEKTLLSHYDDYTQRQGHRVNFDTFREGFMRGVSALTSHLDKMEEASLTTEKDE